MSSTRPIGIFDSGIGGLTIAKSIKELLPKEQLIYFGDTVHLPYGDKSSTSIKNYASKISNFLLEKECKAIVIACNSASTVASKLLQKSFGDKLPIINVIDPTVQAVANSKSAKKVGVIGTKKTVSSGVYAKRLKALNSKIEVFSKATPLLAPMIEEGFFNNNISRTIINSYLSSPHLKEIDTIILGCTHYPLIKEEIEEYYPNSIHILDSSKATAQALENQLTQLDLKNEKPSKNEDIFYVSDYTLGFEKAAKLFFGHSVKLKESRIFD